MSANTKRIRIVIEDDSIRESRVPILSLQNTFWQSRKYQIRADKAIYKMSPVKFSVHKMLYLYFFGRGCTNKTKFFQTNFNTRRALLRLKITIAPNERKKKIATLIFN